MSNTIKKTLKEIDEQIQLEYEKAKKAMALKKELEALNEEEARLKEELGIDEVKVGGRHSGDEWYEQDLPTPEFEKIGSHLKEMDDMDTEDVAGYFEEKLAELGRELDAKLADTDMEDEAPMDDMEGDMDMDMDGDMEGDMEDDMIDEEGVEDDRIAEDDKESDAPEVLEVDANDIIDEEAADDAEPVEEQAGDSVANHGEKKIKGDDGMTKVDNKNPMADKMYEGEETDSEEVSEAEDLNESANAGKEVITEEKSTDSSVLMEGLSDREKDALQRDLERMRSLVNRR